MISITKKIIFTLLFSALIFNSALFMSRVFSYDDKISHPSLTNNIAEVYNKNSGNKLSKEEINWLKQGSIEEDIPIRWMNHFYEPSANKGIWGFSSSKDWAQNQALQSFYFATKGDQTWQKAIDSYAKGDKKTAFIALGHVLHLIEDATVPAHTRLDAHPTGDPYEGWTKDVMRNNITFNISPIATNNLSDSFYQLALYSSKYFLSKDTIDGNVLSRFNAFKKNNIIKCIEGIDNLNNKFCLVLVEESFFNRNYFIDDPIVHSDYFNLLAPKAVSYGAGVIDLFFKEAERKKQEEQQKSWWDKTKNWLKNNINNFSSSLLNLAGDNNSASNSNFNQNFQINENAINNLANENNNQENSKEQNQETNNIISIKPEFKPQANEDKNNQNDESENNKPTDQQEGSSNEGQSDEEQGSNIENKKGDFKQEKLPEDEKAFEPENKDEAAENSQENTAGSPVGNNSNSSSSSSNNQNEESSDNLLPDITAPETFATSTLFINNQTIATSTAIFDFSSSEENSIFQCQLDNASSTICASPIEYNNLSTGSHEFKVWAIDQADNQDQSPAVFNWTVDIVFPQISNISVSNITSDSAKISFITDKPTYAKIEYGTTILYGEETIWETATSTNHSISLSSLSPGQEYHFSVWAKDDLGNTSNSVDDFFNTTEAPHVVISEIQTSGAGGANDEWIELYNPTNQPIDLFDWSIQYRGGDATTFSRKNFTPENTIPANGFFLIGNNSYAGGAPADLSHNTFRMSGSGGNIFLVNNQITLESATSTAIIDKISYGSGANLFPEGTVFSPAPSASESLERKANAMSTAETLSIGSDKWQGNSYDSNDNSQDFVLQNSPTPQNSQFLIEPRNSFPTLATGVPWPIFQKNEKRQARAETGPTDLTARLLFNDDSLDFYTPPVIGENKIFVGSGTGLYAFDLSGNQLWFYPSNRVFSIIIASNENIYFGTVSGLFCVSESGVLQWKYSVAGELYLNIDKNGIIYAVSSNKFYAFYPDGKLKWIFNVSDPPLGRSVDGAHSGFPAIDNSREKIYVNMGQYFYAVDFNGSLDWDFRNNISFQPVLTHVFTTPAIGDDGTIYICSDGEIFPSGGFYALNPSGTVKWFSDSGYNSNAILSPAIGADGFIYFVANSGGAGATELFSFNTQTGAKQWNVSVFDPWASSPLIANNSIYLAAGREVRVFDFDGNMTEHWSVGGGSYLNDGFGSVDDNGNIYFTVKGMLYKIGS